ncbi:LAQU0S08e04324g1_1 [Lachancea quebecensis]|uniref:Biogenesis of lysosome-related organelles complex 1 subunit KXD1 n=1 Tax=Lachancea quebecensis TaxID=1654605 RepID=A0A0P1KTN6_9SACH|nr:LAQU0S08e04324g1_1 [Lachancea quebecensis]
MDEDSSGSVGLRSRTASVNSQMYAIPEPEEIDIQLSEGSSGSEFDDSDYDIESDDDVGSGGDAFLDRMVPETSNTFVMGQLDTPMFDISKYLFQSLSQALNAADFSEAIALQTRTSGLINSKSRELENLSQEVQQKLRYFETRFSQGAQTSKRISRNLQHISKQVDKIGSAFETRYPIEFNQAREEIFERKP